VAHVVRPERRVPLVDAGRVVPGVQSGKSAHRSLLGSLTGTSFLDPVATRWQDPKVI
jgi:hypothetical protein